MEKNARGIDDLDDRATDFPQDAKGAEGVDKLLNYALCVRVHIV